jgi:hypothetical protein
VGRHQKGDGLGAEAELHGELAVGAAGGDQVQDLTFPAVSSDDGFPAATAMIARANSCGRRLQDTAAGAGGEGVTWAG